MDARRKIVWKWEEGKGTWKGKDEKEGRMRRRIGRMRRGREVKIKEEMERKEGGKE